MSDFWQESEFWTADDTDDFESLVSSVSTDIGIIARNMGTIGDGHGGYIEDWQARGTVNLKVSAVGDPAERMIGGQLVGISDVMLTMPTDTDVRSGDKVSVGSQDYEVSGVMPRRTHEARRRVYARAVGNA